MLPNRPLSPHLQIYSPQISSVLSILHRITGAALGLGLLLLVWWLTAAANGGNDFAVVQGFIASWMGRAILLGFSWALFFHLCNGIRHLVWDAGYGFELSTISKSGWTVVIAAFVMTFGAWMISYIVRG
jgi:succinate dehydrogenase / fumarate reductase cytochrome b subunit